MSSSETCRTWLRANPWSVYAAVASSVAALLALYCRRRAYPANLLLLAAFTAAEAFTVGSVVAFTDRTALLHALLLSLSSSVALTLYTLQTRRDFSGLAPYLFALLAACLAAGVVRAFRPFSRSTDLLFACGGAAAFGGYIVHDTQAMMRRVSPEEYVVAAVDLYLDVVNLFLQVLRIVQDLRG
ncbi:inhibitor of apoptosis-promoting Bax1-domain-containing protein [Hyaloraphidium curvatum]|nr:inhibitor of apoptosis-promoting Bax1-domain-containing protein [Hyaloraphidium curvatum]